MMGEPLRLILLVVPLIAGAIAIFFAFQLMKRYDAPFVSSYFYYLVFIYIFGAYSLAGSGILEHLLTRMDSGMRVIHSARLFAIFLGIPFLALANFMLLKSVMEFLQKKVLSIVTIPYFFSSMLAFLIYGFFVVRLTRFNLGEYQQLIIIQRWVYIGYTIASYLIIFLLVMLSSRRISDHNRKRFIRIFGSWYLLYMTLSSVAFALISLHVVFPHIFIFVFLSLHLIPILFLSVYLEKYHGKTSLLQDDFESKLMAFSGKYEISKREREVLELLCRGQSNQEISDALFISLQTVKDHVHRIFVKTGVKNRVQLANMIRSGK